MARPATPSVLFVHLALAAALPAQVVFSDQAAATGTSHPSFGRGAVMVDFDGDDRLDLAAFNVGMDHGFFRQRPDHGFDAVNDDWGVAPDTRASWGALATDFDGDGDPDVYVINGGFVGAQANQVLRNDLSDLGVLTDVSSSSGDGALINKDFGGTALDADGDGDVDVFLSSTNDDECTMLRNDGGLVFTDISVIAGLTQRADHRHCSSGDFDNDGWVDVAVGVSDGQNRLYHNEGGTSFLDVAFAAGVASDGQSFGLVLEDFDNDGWLDVFEPKYQPFTVSTTSRLFRNQGDGSFVDVTAGSGMTGQSDMGHNTGDVDGDGYPDIYIGTGNPAFEDLDLLFLVTPDGAGGFVGTDVSGASGITSLGPTRCHGMAFGDYDADGDVDIWVNNGGPDNVPSSLEENALWRNEGNDNGWIALRLDGVLSNRAAVGARVKAITSSGREVHRAQEVGTGFANTDSPILHFGLGADAGVTRLEVRWPSGIVQTLLAPQAGTRIDMIETGLRLQGDTGLGDAFSIEFAGHPAHVATLIAGLESGTWPLPKFGGVLTVAPPFTELVTLTLDAVGRADLPLTMPNDPMLAGLVIFSQAWVRAPGSSQGGVLTNPLTIVVD